jgi:hypothetical protein
LLWRIEHVLLFTTLLVLRCHVVYVLPSVLEISCALNVHLSVYEALVLCSSQIKGMKALHESTLATTRAAAAAELKQLKTQTQNEMAARTASREYRRKSLAAATAAAASAASAAVASSAAAAAAASGDPAAIQAAAAIAASAGAIPYTVGSSLSGTTPTGSRQVTPLGHVEGGAGAMRMSPLAAPGFSLDGGIMEEEDSFDEGGYIGAKMLAKGASEAVQALEVARAAADELRAKVTCLFPEFLWTGKTASLHALLISL